MKLFFVFVVCIFSSSFSSWSYAQSVSVDVKLVPAGSFKAETKKVTGRASKSPQGVNASDIIVDLKSLTTGVSLRDKHLKERLMVTKYPQAKLIQATGRSGKGKATLEIKGKKQEVEGTYKISGETLEAEFSLSLSDLDIKDVKYMGVGVADKVVVHVTVPVGGKK